MTICNVFTPTNVVLFVTKHSLSEEFREYFSIDLLIRSIDEEEIEKSFILKTQIVSDVLFDVIYEGSVFAENLVDTEYIFNSVPVFNETGEILYEMSIEAVLSDIFSDES
jgi:hypothetical protein